MSSGNYSYEKIITSSVLKVTACAWAANYELYGSIGAQIGEEALQSNRYSSETSDIAAGATGLGSWTLTAHANARLVGVRAGMKFGIGNGVWSPYETTWWTVGGARFVGEETVQISKSGRVTLTNDAGEKMGCAVSGSGFRVFGNRKSDGAITLQDCKMSVGMECLLPKSIALTTAGYMGGDESEAVINT